MFRKRSIIKSKGNVFILCLFIIVVMSLLGTSLMKLNWSNQDAVTREYLGSQAWFYAQSTTEWGLTELYPLGEVTPDISDNCRNKVDGMPPAINYGNCRLISLTCQNTNKRLDGESFFRIAALVECGSGANTVQRSQEVWVKE